MELGSVTLKRIGFFCFPIKHSTHTRTKDQQCLSISIKEFPVTKCVRLFVRWAACIERERCYWTYSAHDTTSLGIPVQTLSGIEARRVTITQDPRNIRD
jgi:hypothetical protein